MENEMGSSKDFEESKGQQDGNKRRLLGDEPVGAWAGERLG